MCQKAKGEHHDRDAQPHRNQYAIVPAGQRLLRSIPIDNRRVPVRNQRYEISTVPAINGHTSNSSPNHQIFTKTTDQ